jgi:hypothetical protein
MRPRTPSGSSDARLGKTFIETKDVAAIMGWNVDKARYWLKREGAAVKRGGRWYTTRSTLAAAFPGHFPGGDALLETREVARLMQWTTDKARYWLKREGAAVKRGGRWYTTESRLRAEFSGTFERLGARG